MNVLLCNIGGSDLDRDQLKALKELSERERAARILAEYGTYGIGLKLPIISKALRHVQRQAGDLVCIVLVASNQQPEDAPSDDQTADTSVDDQTENAPPDDQDQAFWKTDTCLTAEVVQRRLTEPDGDWQPVPVERIRIWKIADALSRNRDPSDYDVVRRFFEQKLPLLAAEYPDATVYLEVTGGTPAMTTGLLVAGTEVFGANAEVLYVHPHSPLPYTLNTGKRLQSGPLRSALRSNIATYAYDVALRTFREHASVITDRLEHGAPTVLDALLRYAHCRFNFDFEGARQALEGGIDREGDGRWRNELVTLYNAVCRRERDTLLEEVYHGAVARYAIASYADFLTQVVRFQENVLRALCLDRGTVFLDWQENCDPDGARIQQEWIDQQGITWRFSRQRNPIAGRTTLRELLQHLVTQRGEEIATLLDKLDQLENLARLRNDLTHNFEGVRRQTLAQRFHEYAVSEQDADAILPHLSLIYQDMTGRSPGASPFLHINTVIDGLLREVSPRSETPA